MAISTEIMEFFSDEICKLAAMPALKVPGMGSKGQISSLEAKPAHAQAGNFAKATKDLKTPTTGSSSSRSGISHTSMKAVGSTGSTALPPPPVLR
jgi:hypothetical protein